MKVRKIQFDIDYTHILTFREEYKNAIIPYFGLDEVRYAIENENTIDEKIRLIFKNEAIAILFRKDGISYIYEGDSNETLDSVGVTKFFWDIFEKTKLFRGYLGVNRNHISIMAVETLEEDSYLKIADSPRQFSQNPFGKLEDWTSIYDFEKEPGKTYKIQFGNFCSKDISKHEISPFKTKYNEDLKTSNGLLAIVDIFERKKSANFSQYKKLFSEAISYLPLISDITNGRV